MLNGLLVDLVPYGAAFRPKHHTWWNNESKFWGSMGEYGLISRARIDRMHEQWDSDDDPGWYGVPFGIMTKDGTPIGYFGINDVNPYSRCGILGAVIGEPDYWGGGYGTDALLLIADYAFCELDLRRLWLMTMSLNERVMRQMEKVGFTLEVRNRRATLVDGVWHDVVVYGLLRDEWPGRAVMIERLGLEAR